MAAHVIVALAQVARELNVDRNVTLLDEPNWEGLKAATELSSWTEDLDPADCEGLVAAVSIFDTWGLYEWMEIVAPKYLARWAGLGFPTCREDWMKARIERSER